MMWTLLLACVDPAPEWSAPPPPLPATCRVWPVPEPGVVAAGNVARTPEGERFLYAWTPRPGVEGPRLWTVARRGGTLHPEPWWWGSVDVLGLGVGDVDDDGIDEVALIERDRVVVLDGVTHQEIAALPWDGRASDSALLLDLDGDDRPEVHLHDQLLDADVLLGEDGLPVVARGLTEARWLRRVETDGEPVAEVLATDGVHDPATGALLWEAPGSVRGAGDVDGDGLDEVLVSGADMVALHRPGRGEVAWSLALPGWGVGWVNLLDADGDGDLDVTVRVGAAAGQAEHRILDAATGALLRSVTGPAALCEACPSFIGSSMFTPDVDGDGRADQVFFSDRWVQRDPWTDEVVAEGLGKRLYADDGALLDVDGDGASEVLTVGAMEAWRRWGAATWDAASCELIGVSEQVAPVDVVGPLRIFAAQGATPEVLVQMAPGATREWGVSADGQLTAIGSQSYRIDDARRADVNGDGLEEWVVRDGVSVLAGGVFHYTAAGHVQDLQVGDVDGDGRVEAVTVSETALCAWDLGNGQEIDCWPLAAGQYGLALLEEGGWTRVIVQDLAAGGDVVTEARLRRGWWTPALPYRLRGLAPGPLLTGAGRVWVRQPGLLTGWRLGAPRAQLVTLGEADRLDSDGSQVVLREPTGVAWWAR